ncbi:MAG: hypothetical protein V3U72_05255 [Candidatus Aenigmarchaeota archaeon]
MDEFIVLLIVALVIIGAMMLIGTPLADWAGGEWPGGGGTTGNYKSLASFDLGRVGSSETEVSRTLSFGSFTLGQTQAETLKEMSTLGVSQGYFGSDSKKFDVRIDQNVLSNLKDVKISFDMGETNLYGNLAIKWNDKMFFDKLANLNRYDVVIPPENVKESNTLEISAGNPGIYFWAATYYELSNFRVLGEYGPEKFMSFKVYPDEIESWSKGTLRFYTTKGQQGEITVKLNGKEIYRSSNPEHLVTKEFEYSEIGNALRIGDNILAFKSDDTFEIDDVEFEISLSSGGVTKEKDMNITIEDMNLLSSGKGEIKFTVKSIYRQGVLNINIGNNQLNLQTVRSGENTIEFDSNDVVEGTNTITFSGTGSWDISDAEIGIRY